MNTMNTPFLDTELKKRALPPLLVHDDGSAVTKESWSKRKRELIYTLSKYSYGFTPAAPTKVWAKNEKTAKTAFASKATHKSLELCFDTPNGEFSFPVHIYTPNKVENPPAFLYIKGRQNMTPDPFSPNEEIIDNGFALVLVSHGDVIRDTLDDDFDTGLLGMYRKSGEKRKDDEWGRIGAWAFACSRVMDYLEMTHDVDTKHVALCGQSRLGKTVLWAAAQDERFFMTCSNNSGFGGAAIHRYGTGERVADFIRAGSWNWYCENFKSFLGKEEDNDIYDQHMLLACVAPRHICVGSAELDKGADPNSEFLNCFAVSEVFELLGHTGLVTPDRYPTAGDDLNDGDVAYHMRFGSHFFSRDDWLSYMKYFRKLLNK